MLNVVIIEDEPLAATALRTWLHQTGKVRVTGMARDGAAGLVLCADHVPDAAFLDINMPGPDGLQLAAHLAVLPHPPLIVFTTGHAERACEAFRLNVVDYLLKPLDPAIIHEAVRRLEERVAARSCIGQNAPTPVGMSPPHIRFDRLPVKWGQDDVISLLPPSTIVAALRHDRRVWIHTAFEEFETYYTLANLLAWLGDPPFLPLSRHAIVSLQGIDKVIHYGDRLYKVRLRDRCGTWLTASRSGARVLASSLKPQD